jgi:hypothetical protein
MKKSEYKAGTFLVNADNHVFLHDGYLTGDGYGALIGETCSGKIERASDFGNFCMYPIRGKATEQEINDFMRKVMNAQKIDKY